MPKQSADYDELLAMFYEYSPFFARGSEKQVEFYVEEALRLGDPVLELGAATGLYTVPMARARLRVHALDISEDMIAYLAGRLAKEPTDVAERVTLHQEDMRSFDIAEQFRCVTMPGNALNALPTARDQLATLRNVHRHLHEDGQLVLDVFTPNLMLLSQRSDYSWCEFSIPEREETYLCHRYTSIEPLRQVLRVRYIHEELGGAGGECGRRRLHQLDYRYVFPSELALMLQLAGFTVSALYGGFEGRPLKTAYEGHTIAVARKR